MTIDRELELAAEKQSARNREIADAYNNQRLGALEMLRAAERRPATDAAAGGE